MSRPAEQSYLFSEEQTHTTDIITHCRGFTPQINISGICRIVDIKGEHHKYKCVLTHVYVENKSNKSKKLLT